MKNLAALLVTAIVIFIFSFGCKKKTTGPPGSEHTSGMAGVRNWKVHHVDNDCPAYGIGVDTTYENSSAVTVVNDVTVVLGSLTLDFTAYDATKKTITFSHYDGYREADSIVYYYAADSMAYSSFVYTSVCQQIYFNMHTL